LSGRKKEKPTPADVVKTPASTQFGEVVPNMTTAYQALNSKTCEQKYMQTKNFLLIIPYLQALKNANDGSVIGFSSDSQNCMAEVHVFPGFMNTSHSFVCPVVSLNAAHLKGVHKGMIYAASVLSAGTTNVYPIGFMFAKGNED
jgi:hypothetical protein